jgi:hypothetical protein
MNKKRPTIEEIDAETEELLQRATTLKEKVIEDTMEMVDGYLPKNIQEWRERHPRPLNEQNDRPWQEIMAEFLENQGAVFRNLEASLTAPYSKPEDHKGHTIVGGGDWAKINDSTALSLMCVECKAEVVLDRFNEIDYYFQVQRLEALHSAWGVKYWRVELNSMGQVIFEQLQRRGIPVIGFTTTLTSKRPLIESFSLGLERGLVKLLPDTVGQVELQAYEVKHTETGSKYSAPDGMHDDTVIARALAYMQMRETPAANPDKVRRQRDMTDAIRRVF